MATIVPCSLEKEEGAPSGPRRLQTEIDVDANDSGNELSMGGSSSEGDSMSHHRGEHSPNHHHQDNHLGSGPPPPQFTGSLFDTPPSMIQSPQQQPQFQFNTGFGLGLPQDSFRCSVCSKSSTIGVLPFVCAHKTCQSCYQMTPSSYDRRACKLCGAVSTATANFTSQMYLSPTLPSPPRGALMSDCSTPTMNNHINSSTPLHQPRAFSFSLSGMPGSPSPVMGARMPSSAGGLMMRPIGFPDSDSSLTSWSPLQQPSQLSINNLSSIGGHQQQSPMLMQNVFDSLAVNDDTPVFSPLSPTNTSMHMPPSLMASPDVPKHSATIAPPRNSMCSTPRLQLATPMSSQSQQTFPIPSPLGSQPQQQQPMGPIQCQGCESKISFAYCMQCQEALCIHCVQAHQRVRATKQHAFVELQQLMATLMSRAVQPQQAQQYTQNVGGSVRQALGSVGSGDVFFSGHVSGVENDSIGSGESSPRSSSVCGTHDSVIIGICENCPHSVLLCAICVAQHPGKHRVQPLGDIRVAVGEVVNESQLLQWQCEKTGDTIKQIIDGIVTNATTAENEIRAAFDTHVNALEERRKELLKRVETVKNLKLSVLISQAESLQSKQIDLQQAIQTATKLMDSSDCDEMVLRQVFEKLASCQMGNEGTEPNNNILNVLMLACQVNEDDRLKFTAPQDGILLNKARQFGNIESGPCAKNSSIVGDSFKKAIRERQTVIYVQLRDACGDLLSSSIAATQPTSQALLPHQEPHSHLEQAMPTSDVQAFVISPDGSTVEVTMTPRENGIVALSYYPSIEGSYTLNILVKGTPISGCPTTMDIRRGRNYDEIAAKGPILTFGKEGSGDGELCRPWGICVDQRGRVIVADRSNNRVQIFDKDGNFISKFGTSGNRPGQFDRPAGITTNSLNNIVVADKDNHRVQVFDENGMFLLKFGDRGRAVGYFNYPWGVATNSHNAIAVSDTRNHRVQIFTPQGQFVRKCGFDSAYFFKNLDSPRGLCYLPDGQLLITDFNNHRLAVLSPRNMSEMKVYGSEGDGDGMFVRPQGVVIDPEGHILVCDSRNNRVQVFASDDMRFIGSFGLGPVPNSGFQMPQELPAPYSSLGGPFGAPAFSSAPTPLTPSPRQLLDRPTDLAVGPDGRIYVVDFGNNCIRVF
ncbi:Protein lin-41 [Caenorhabditis elegans]|uniref:Protein lin-41 n=1 Tax=Caenorhabditis elegans TaxID=6239 RepID=LIN41_CAEEL|nr:Protein lin-41 [Caenorhabditis elegans]Q9U489.1 RecName: Full=Protein lin-41; AltName: Full=Abnormal cell lineage protein 41 [Caenorhabditis elegans]AAF15530.1 LIN-41B [Caenorhabditis elegans]CAC42254.1 Protein lin-41 [Caenorhabditis elegans]|eukprot:NP_001020998.1 Protein lin-41 [Caenorhabditis elegans]